ncbi:MAG: hypothetical protein KDA87_24025 [Planctomycetales bacterium]|nr:hypothetical protein [Planctomycetales bacterium]
MFRRSFVIALVMFLTPASYASLVFSVSDVTVIGDGVNPTTGQVLVSWDYTDPTPMDPPEQFSGWDLYFNLVDVGPEFSSITITGFADPSSADVLPGDMVNDAGGAAPIYDLNYTSAIGSTTNLVDGNLMVIDFSVPAGEFGDFEIQFVDQFMGNTLTQASNAFSSPSTVGIPYSFNNGTVTISAVPEPATWINGFLFAVGLSVASFRYFKSRK